MPVQHENKQIKDHKRNKCIFYRRTYYYYPSSALFVVAYAETLTMLPYVRFSLFHTLTPSFALTPSFRLPSPPLESSCSITYFMCTPIFVNTTVLPHTHTNHGICSESMIRIAFMRLNYYDGHKDISLYIDVLPPLLSLHSHGARFSSYNEFMRDMIAFCCWGA